MADTISNLVDCIAPGTSSLGADLNPLKAFQVIIDSFLTGIPNLVKVNFIIPKIAQGTPIPQIAFDAITLGLKNADFPSFKMKFPGVGELKFDGKIKLGVDVFDPNGLVKFFTGLLKIATGIPELFIDLKKKIPLPSLPTPSKIEELIKASLDLPDGVSALPKDFVPKFTNCIVKSVTSTILP